MFLWFTIDEKMEKLDIDPIEQKVESILNNVKSSTRTQILNLIHRTPGDWLQRLATSGMFVYNFITIKKIKIF